MSGILDLPEEILCQIVDLVPSSFRECVCVCRQWRAQVTQRLYTDPTISDTKSYVLFVDTVLEKPEYGRHVRILDLSRVIGTLHTSRMPDLMRACPDMREFYSPQAAFTPHMMQVLPSLTQLRLLDLACCIERFEISRVINYCADLPRLHTFRYPRCAISTAYPIKRYPPALRHLAVRGGLRDEFLRKMTGPDHPTLRITALLIAYAPAITSAPTLAFIASIRTLASLTVSWPIMRFGHNSLDAILVVAPSLRFLSVSVDYIGPRFFENRHATIEVLEFRFSGSGKRHLVTSEDLIEAIDEDEHYPNLSAVGISGKLSDQFYGEDAESSREALAVLAGTRGVRLYELQDSDTTALDGPGGMW